MRRGIPARAPARGLGVMPEGWWVLGSQQTSGTPQSGSLVSHILLPKNVDSAETTRKLETLYLAGKQVEASVSIDRSRAESLDRRPRVSTEPMVRAYSCRRATIGSTRAARTAGDHDLAVGLDRDGRRGV